MVERERLAAEARRLEWLADAKLGPARLHPAATRPLPDRAQGPPLLVRLLRRGQWAAAAVGRSLRRVGPRGTHPSARVTEQISG
jgi:hypothetical protein